MVKNIAFGASLLLMPSAVLAQDDQILDIQILDDPEETSIFETLFEDEMLRIRPWTSISAKILRLRIRVLDSARKTLISAALTKLSCGIRGLAVMLMRLRPCALTRLSPRAALF